MHHFFVEPGHVGKDVIKITGGDVNHIRNVLRMREGEELIIADGSGAQYRCVLTESGETSVSARILWKYEAQAELPSEITLYQGIAKGDRMDLVIQKSVELGAARIVPVNTARVIVKLDEKKEAARLRRWREIAKSAAKQSGRSCIPEVCGMMDFGEALEDASALDRLIIPYERAAGMEHTRSVFGGIAAGDSVGIFIGPEGGFEESEVRAAVQAGAEAVTLGRRILRTETAGPSVLSILAYLLEE